MAITKRDERGRILCSSGNRRYKTVEEMEEAIDAYFEKCAGRFLTNAKGEQLYDKYGLPIIVQVTPPTTTGLALALGFDSRTSLFNYKRYGDSEDSGDDSVSEDERNEKRNKEKPYLNTITRALSRIEEYTEGRLYDKEGANGAKFSLVNNFRGWNEKPDGAEVNNNVTLKVALTDD